MTMEVRTEREDERVALHDMDKDRSILPPSHVQDYHQSPTRSEIKHKQPPAQFFLYDQCGPLHLSSHLCSRTCDAARESIDSDGSILADTKKALLRYRSYALAMRCRPVFTLLTQY
eukprot:1394466-Rhodomonas_salina.3